MRTYLIILKKKYILIDEDDLLFWNMFKRVVKDILRTTNSLEGFHRVLNNFFLNLLLI
jgi:GR25 family glycosyltransferase involved in LPS biosynthesis